MIYRGPQSGALERDRSKSPNDLAWIRILTVRCCSLLAHSRCCTSALRARVMEPRFRAHFASTGRINAPRPAPSQLPWGIEIAGHAPKS